MRRGLDRKTGGSMRRAHTVTERPLSCGEVTRDRHGSLLERSGGAGRRPRLVSGPRGAPPLSLRPRRGGPPRPRHLAAGWEPRRRRSSREVLHAGVTPARLRVEPEQLALLLRHADLDREAEALEVARHQRMVVRPEARGENPRDLARLRRLHVLPKQLL